MTSPEPGCCRRGLVQPGAEQLLRGGGDVPPGRGGIVGPDGLPGQGQGISCPPGEAGGPYVGYFIILGKGNSTVSVKLMRRPNKFRTEGFLLPGIGLDPGLQGFPPPASARSGVESGPLAFTSASPIHLAVLRALDGYSRQLKLSRQDGVPSLTAVASPRTDKSVTSPGAQATTSPKDFRQPVPASPPSPHQYLGHRAPHIDRAPGQAVHPQQQLLGCGGRVDAGAVGPGGPQAAQLAHDLRRGDSLVAQTSTVSTNWDRTTPPAGERQARPQGVPLLNRARKAGAPGWAGS